MLVNAANVASLTKGYRTIFMEELQGAKPLWERVALRTPSTSKSEDYYFLDALPGMRKLVGEVVIKNLSGQKYTIANEEWEDTIQVDQFDIETDNHRFYEPRFRALAVAAAQHVDELVCQLLGAGFDTECYTGKNFFDSNHEPKKGGVKFSNVGVKKLSAANFRIGRDSLIGRLNAEGRSMGLGRKLVLIVAHGNASLAREIVVADRNANGAYNVDVGTAELVVWPQLAAVNPDAWFILETGLPLRPLIVQMQKEPDVAAVTNPDDSYVVLNHKFIYQAYGRYNAGYGLPELAYGSDGSQAA